MDWAARVRVKVTSSLDATVWDNFPISAENFGTFFIVIAAERSKSLRKNSTAHAKSAHVAKASRASIFYPGALQGTAGKIALRRKEPDE